MDKQDNSMSNYNHGINLFERKSLVITGVKKIENFGKNFLFEIVPDRANPTSKRRTIYKSSLK